MAFKNVDAYGVYSEAEDWSKRGRHAFKPWLIPMRLRFPPSSRISTYAPITVINVKINARRVRSPSSG